MNPFGTARKRDKEVKCSKCGATVMRNLPNRSARCFDCKKRAENEYWKTYVPTWLRKGVKVPNAPEKV